MQNIKFPVGRKIDDEFFTYKLVCNAKKVVNIDNILYNYRMRKTSVMNENNSDRLIYDRIDCLLFNCQCVETVIGLETWDVSNVKDFSGFFSQCSNLKNVNVSRWKLHNATIMVAMFYNCKNLKKIDGIDTWEFDDNNRQHFIPVLEKTLELNGINQAFLITHNLMFRQYPVDIINLEDLDASTIKVTYE